MSTTAFFNTSAKAKPPPMWQASHLRKLQFVASCIIATLPFTQLFTIDLGFPLKIYEILIIMWMGYSFAFMHVTLFSPKIFIRGLMFAAYSVCALYIILNIFGNVGTYTDLARISPFLDGALKSAYIVIFVCGFDIIASAASRNPKRAVNMWLYGAAVSAVIQLVLFGLTAAGRTLPELPGMIPTPRDQQFVVVYGLNFFRAGTFTEGNYAGPFFLLSILIAVAYGRYRYVWLFLVTMATTFSTTAVVGLGVAMIYLMLTDRKNFIAYSAISTIVLCILLSTGALDAILIDKINDKGQQSSVTTRKRTFSTAMEMFEENPFWGVGIEQYGFFRRGAEQFGKKNGTTIKLGLMKGIPNNVYIELASELGLLGIGFFVYFLIPIFKLTSRCPHPSMRAGTYIILVTWVASPTFAFMYYWGFWAMACGIARYSENAKLEAASGTEKSPPIPLNGQPLSAG